RGECARCVGACPAGAEVILHGFEIADRFAVVTECQVDPPSGVIDKPDLVVSSRNLADGVRREHFERLPAILFGLREVTKALLGWPIGPSCVMKPLVSND